MSIKVRPYTEMLYVINEENPYHILNVTENADLEEITFAFINYSKIFHPNIYYHLQGTQKFKDISAIYEKISSAYNALKDSEERKKIDLYLSVKRKLEYLALGTGDNTKVRNLSKLETEILNINKAEIKTENQKSFEQQNPDIFKSPAVKDYNKNIRSTSSDIMKSTMEIKLEQSMSLFLQGKRFYHQDETDKAIDSFKNAIDMLKKENNTEKSEISVFYSYLGLALLKKGWESYAQAEFRIALSYNPFDEIALKYCSQKKAATETNPQTINKTFNKFENKGIYNRMFHKK